MPFKQKLAEKSGLPEAKLPSSYQIIGDLLLVKLPKLNEKEKKKTAKAIKEMLPHIKTI